MTNQMASLKTDHWIELGSLLIVLLILSGGTYLFGPSIRARYLFYELGALQIGHSSFEDAQRLAMKLSAKQGDAGVCERAHCSWMADVSNARLPEWWRGPGSFFRISFEVNDSVVTSKGAVFSIGIDPDSYTPSSVGFGVQQKWLRFREGDREIAEPPIDKGWLDIHIEENGRRRRPFTRFVVHMTPRTLLEDWRRYTAFNYRCLWVYKGCKDGTELLPTAGPIPG